MFGRYLDPPPGIPPEVLFRRLLDPRPSTPLRFRVGGLEHLELHVVALPSRDVNLAVDAAVEAPAELRHGRRIQELLVRCLWGSAGPAFTTAALGHLTEDEFGALSEEAERAFAAICPTYAWSNAEAWRVVLERGARHPTNRADAQLLAACIDMGPRHVVFRPDRYWGVPPRDLLDGHRLCFHAARAVYDPLLPAK